MADQSETLYAFNKADSAALLKTIGKESTDGGNGQSWESIPFDTRLAIASGTITARSGTTLGTGTVTLKKIGSAGATSTMTLSNMGGTTSSLTVFNPGSAIASGAYVLCFRVGDKWLAVEVC